LPGGECVAQNEFWQDADAGPGNEGRQHRIPYGQNIETAERMEAVVSLPKRLNWEGEYRAEFGCDGA
jgi:hypothetical protein